MLRLLLLLSLGSVVTGCNKPATNGPARLPTIDYVKLTIDSGDPKVTTIKFTYKEKMTVQDILVLAQVQGITSVYEGKGAGAMLKSIQGISNQGGGKEAKNWIFYVNNKQATISSAVYSLQPGDAIIWRFEKYE